jgi:hypothetical protein
MIGFRDEWWPDEGGRRRSALGERERREKKERKERGATKARAGLNF